MKLLERLQAATEPFVLERNLTKDALKFVRLALKTTQDSNPFAEKEVKFKSYHEDGRACARKVYEELRIVQDTSRYDDDSLYFETSAVDPDTERNDAFLTRAAYHANRYYASPTDEVRADAIPEARTALASVDNSPLFGQIEQIFDYLKARRIRRFVRLLELDLTTATNPIQAMRPYGKEAAALGLSNYLLSRRDQLLTQ